MEGHWSHPHGKCAVSGGLVEGEKKRGRRTLNISGCHTMVRRLCKAPARNGDDAGFDVWDLAQGRYRPNNNI